MPDTVFVTKKDILEILNKNLIIHVKIYDKALTAFKENYIKKLKTMLDNAKSKKGKCELVIGLMEPENHKGDYESAIKMIELSCRDEIELREDEFNRYVLNKWNWMSSFRHSYMSNVFSSSSCSSTSSKSSDSDITAYFAGADSD